MNETESLTATQKKKATTTTTWCEEQQINRKTVNQFII